MGSEVHRNRKRSYEGGCVKRALTVELLFPLPTWNRILSMSLRERMKLKRLIKNMTSLCTQYDEGSQTLTVPASKRLSMDLLKTEYLLMIRPTTSKQLNSPKKKEAKKKQLLRF